MGEPISYALAQPLSLPASSLTVTDDGGPGRTVTVLAGWYAILLANALGTGAELDPAELLGAIETALGASQWSVTLRPSGRVRLTYLGTTPGKIAWASTTLRNVLGFADPVGPLSTGQWAEGEYQPTHGLYAETALDGGWQVEPGRVAGGVMPDGVSYGWQDGLGGQRREVTLRLLPKTSAEALTLDTEATPALAPVERVVLLGADEPGQAPPWSCADTQATAVGRLCGWTDDLQGVIAGTVTTIERVSIDTASLGAARSRLSVERYDPRRDFGPLTLCWVDRVSV